MMQGRPVRIRHGAATVIGNETHNMPLANSWEGVRSRMIRKSGDLSCNGKVAIHHDPGDGRKFLYRGGDFVW